MSTRAETIAVARSWMAGKGTPWRHQACVKYVGVDCIHLIAGVARELGLPCAEPFFATPEYHNYGRHPKPELLLGACDRLMERIEMGTERVADVLVIHFDRHPMHFAFLSQLEPRQLIHAWAGARRVVEHGIEAAWPGRLLRAYHLPGVT